MLPENFVTLSFSFNSIISHMYRIFKISVPRSSFYFFFDLLSLNLELYSIIFILKIFHSVYIDEILMVGVCKQMSTSGTP